MSDTEKKNYRLTQATLKQLEEIASVTNLNQTAVVTLAIAELHNRMVQQYRFEDIDKAAKRGMKILEENDAL